MVGEEEVTLSSNNNTLLEGAGENRPLIPKGNFERFPHPEPWQPIETAPKVGTFLVFLPDERRQLEVMYRSENTSIVGGAFGFDRTKPTHWMPLPAPPRSSGRAA